MDTLADILVNVVVLILNGTLTKKKAKLAVKFAYKLVEVNCKTTEETVTYEKVCRCSAHCRTY